MKYWGNIDRRAGGGSSLQMGIILLMLARSALAADPDAGPTRSADDRSRSGPATLRAFAPIAEVARHSIVKFTVEGRTVALGTVIDTSGLALTKASELRQGTLTCTLAGGQQAGARILATDDDDDLALVQIDAPCLPPIQWASAGPILGQWAVTQGVGIVPEAVGIVSTTPRQILHARAFIGVELAVPSTRLLRVSPEMGAEKAGLKPGDIIVAVDGASVKDNQDLTRALRKYREGQRVRLRVQREKREFDATVEMSAQRTFFLGRGFDRQERMNRLGGPLSKRAEDFELAFQHDSVLNPWQCGGPLLNLQGQAIGLNIARAGRTASYALPPALVSHLIGVLKERAFVVPDE